MDEAAPEGGEEEGVGMTDKDCEHRWVHPAWRFCEKCLIPEPPSPAMQAATPTVASQDAQDGEWHDTYYGPVRWSERGKERMTATMANTLTARMKELERERWDLGEGNKRLTNQAIDALDRAEAAETKLQQEREAHEETERALHLSREGYKDRAQRLEQALEGVQALLKRPRMDNYDVMIAKVINAALKEATDE